LPHSHLHNHSTSSRRQLSLGITPNTIRWPKRLLVRFFKPKGQVLLQRVAVPISNLFVETQLDSPQSHSQCHIFCLCLLVPTDTPTNKWPNLRPDNSFTSDISPLFALSAIPNWGFPSPSKTSRIFTTNEETARQAKRSPLPAGCPLPILRRTKSGICLSGTPDRTLIWWECVRLQAHVDYYVYL